MSDSDSSGRIPELDGIRGLAILLVVLWHYIGDPLRQATDPGGSFIAFGLGLAWSGVDLFFVLSGFLIGGILMDHRASPNYFKAFYTRRVCRIVPIYYVWLLMVLVVLSATFAAQSAGIPQLFASPKPAGAYFTFTQNFLMALSGEYGAPALSVTWSLAIEEQFYLMLPLIVRVIAPKRLPPILIGAIAAAPLLRIILYVVSPSNAEMAAYVLMPCRMDALLSGVGCAYVMRQPNLKQQIARHTAWLYVALTLLIAGSIFIRNAQTKFEVSSWGYSWLALLYTCLLLIAVTERRGLVTGIVRNRALRRLGVIAYGTYLFHQVINGVLHGLILHHEPQLINASDWAVTLGAFAATIIIAQISWTYFEKRLVMLGQRVRYIPAPIPDGSRTLTSAHPRDHLIRSIDRVEEQHADES
jgi:peptidoglycan/LPS O-acetylase OafA/YrhL